ncbi:MAG TPA: hypothetical protein VMJ10_24120 [Kofleriaceae bacterium]|nr:hypothetical protein [Kofleriaceae bacterium]
MKTLDSHIVFALAALVAAGCQQATTDNFQNPPPGVPETCTQIASLPGCGNGSISYGCTSDRPDDVMGASGDSQQLACSAGTPGPNATTQYCCAPFSTYFAGCAVDTTIAGCGATSIGFDCGDTAPSDADPTIACSASLGAGKYCCNTAELSPSCAVESSLAACSGVEVGYNCVDGASPSDGDPSLACTSAGGGDYCCLPFAQATTTCVEAPGVCAPGAFGFTCAPGQSPDALDPVLACGPGGGGAVCCTLK